jgi:hypothetical protein
MVLPLLLLTLSLSLPNLQFGAASEVHTSMEDMSGYQSTATVPAHQVLPRDATGQAAQE